MDDIVKEFLVESRENLDRVERDLVALEKDPNTPGLIAGIFRGVHTIKGGSGFLGLAKVESVSHAGENLLSRLRDGKLVLTAEAVTTLLALSDALRQCLDGVEHTGHEPEQDFAALLSKLAALQSGQAAPVAANPTNPANSTNSTNPSDVVPPPAPSAKTEPAHPAAPASAPATSPGAGASESNVRVDVGLLDKLMDLVGELVLARNQIVQLTSGREDSAFNAASQRLNLVTTELQEEVMKTRLQPIGNIWSKFPRVVRDMAQELRKQVRLEMDGQQTELDRTIIEAIKDPLTHLVRNAIDHGIETPAQRREAGKPETGVLFLRAYHEGGQVNIEISDDGRGIDLARVKAKAVEKALITPDQALRLSDREALQLIFLPGLSTAQKVTNVSGRGVGMDVVKTNIEKVGGSVDLQTEKDRGSTVKIKIPLTLAIIPALMVTSGGDCYAIPQVSLVELVRLDGGQARKGIETIMGTPVYRLRGNLLPIVSLSQVLGNAPCDFSKAEAVNVVVLQADDRQFGLVVDQINDTQEIVVKPLGKHLKGLAVFAGATILGDGKVALILDVLGLAQNARVLSKTRERKLTEQAEATDGAQLARQNLLLFSLGEDRRLAIDLGTVGRLEKFPRNTVERAGSQEVVQYRGQIMKLMRLSDCLSYPGLDGEPGDSMQVVVYSEHGRSVGLIVGRILDIVEDAVRLQSDDARAGVLGKAVIQGRVTELIDVPGLVRSFNPEFISA
ncbi:MAG: chemotaxis protein CheW [Verrucomicrobia bacterium]|nr:chemotaxis protein CheW [Verrucomicrobiota bacterium]